MRTGLPNPFPGVGLGTGDTPAIITKIKMTKPELMRTICAKWCYGIATADLEYDSLEQQNPLHFYFYFIVKAGRRYRERTSAEASVSTA